MTSDFTFAHCEHQDFCFGEHSFSSALRKPLGVLLGLGKAAGADFVEFFLQKGKYVSTLVENGKITSVSPNFILGAGVRVFQGHQDCYVSTTDVSFRGLKAILEQALKIHGFKIESFRLIPEIYFEPFRDYGALKGQDLSLSFTNAVTELCEVLSSCHQKQREYTKYLQSATTSGFYDFQEILVASSDGIFARDLRLAQSLSAQVVCAKGTSRSACHQRSGESGKPHFLKTLNLEDLARTLAERSQNMLFADFVLSGDYPVVLSNGFGGVLFHEACGHLLETTAICSKSTPFASQKGQKIAHENLTAWDEGIWEYGFGSLDMDDEGMPVQKTLLIEKGVLRNFLSDRMGFLQTGHSRTGSGRRQNYSFAPASRMRNTYIANGEFSLEDLFASIDSGLYCKSLGGGSVNGTGAFNFAVEEAWMIEHGRLTKPVKGALLIGQATEIMKKISMSSRDLALSAGFCGSVSGSLYVTVGQPHVKVDNITVGGR
jgi:TldD protein